VKTTNSKYDFEVHSTKTKIIGNRYELEIAMENKIYLEMNYNHQLGNVEMDQTLAKNKAQKL
jgi:hypothetical protein